MGRKRKNPPISKEDLKIEKFLELFKQLENKPNRLPKYNVGTIFYEYVLNVKIKRFCSQCGKFNGKYNREYNRECKYCKSPLLQKQIKEPFILKRIISSSSIFHGIYGNRVLSQVAYNLNTISIYPSSEKLINKQLDGIRSKRISEKQLDDIFQPLDKFEELKEKYNNEKPICEIVNNMAEGNKLGNNY